MKVKDVLIASCLCCFLGFRGTWVSCVLEQMEDGWWEEINNDSAREQLLFRIVAFLFGLFLFSLSTTPPIHTSHGIWWQGRARCVNYASCAAQSVLRRIEANPFRTKAAPCFIGRSGGPGVSLDHLHPFALKIMLFHVFPKSTSSVSSPQLSLSLLGSSLIQRSLQPRRRLAPCASSPERRW